jgi:hypothetical protein
LKLLSRWSGMPSLSILIANFLGSRLIWMRTTDTSTPILRTLLSSVLSGMMISILILAGALVSPALCKLPRDNLKHCPGFTGLRFPPHPVMSTRDEIAPVCRNVSVEIMCPYIDDFLSIVPEENSQHLWDFFTRNVVEKSGLQLSKTAGHLCLPSEVFIGLGIEFDLVHNEARIPQTKLEKIITLVNKWSGYILANRKQLQELLGFLNLVS